jgi:hypothetical protein
VVEDVAVVVVGEDVDVVVDVVDQEVDELEATEVVVEDDETRLVVVVVDELELEVCAGTMASAITP